MPKSKRDIRPPHEPWQPLRVAEPPLGYLSFFYSDGLSPLAVREVTRPYDNKSDPNIETGTYGLFSTCQRSMRASIVKRGVKYLFFVCRRDNVRVVTGYYRVAWYADGVLHAQGADYALAADEVHFIDPPIRLSNLPEPIASVAVRPFRLARRLSTDNTAALLHTLEPRPNALVQYLAEIDRLERFQRFHSGYRYVSWQQEEPFTWDLAVQYLVAKENGAGIVVPNASRTGFWQCDTCRQFVANKALLKRCPYCGTMGSLRPVPQLDGVS
ncbi:MAG: hypothetical protein HY695_13230 [Deltaproteobacteria bacterium]|nr:hypothetical protein [Deltaproteobacteria bacterium]